ncbi:MAG TPA: FMN-binding protein [Acidimicrobiales bacterium]|nr:FMN-binding protein [Acidimicrobiales bacterium]
MRRAPLVAAGTVAGIAGVLAFPVHRSHLTIPSSSARSGGGSSGSPSTPPFSDQNSTGAPAGSGGSGGSSTTTPPTAAAPATRSATGSDVSFRYGDMAVTVTVTGNKITDVRMATISETDGRSVGIDRFAIPQLEQQVIGANSANIDGVSGATFSSQAFVDSVSSALSKLGFS